ncbi:sensor histidine kinase [Paenibacillaceae bacterium]|nr:sensor histidine kinase [Paenibacillaceae bacterium]
MKGLFYKRSVKFNVTTALIVAALLPASVIIFFYYSILSDFTLTKAERYNNEMVEQMNSKLNSLLDQTEVVKKQLIELSITSELFSYYEDKTTSEKMRIIKEIGAQLINIKRSFNIAEDLYLIGLDGSVYSSNPDVDKRLLLEQDWIRQLQSSLDSRVVGTHEAVYSHLFKVFDNPLVVSFTKKISGYYNNQVIGIVQVDLKYAEIKKIVDSVDFGEDGFTFLTNANHQLVYFPDQAYLGENTEEITYKGFSLAELINHTGTEKKNGAMIINRPVPHTDWTMTAVVYTDSIASEFQKIRLITVVVAGLSVLFALAVSFGLSTGITGPIRNMIGSMKKVSEGNFQVSMPDAGSRELQILTGSFHKMISRIDALMNENIQKERDKTATEIRALQSQINSHFLYNTLNTIKWMAIEEKSEAISRTIVALVKILEYSSKQVDRIVSIREEIDFTNEYLFIQKKRYGEELSVKYDLDPILYNCRILKMTLQPIIENAIIHGLSGVDDGEIKVVGRTAEDYITLAIIDNGRGMENTNMDKFTGMGITNVETRLKLHFGEAYGLEITSVPSSGTMVMIKLPLLTD